MQGVFDCTGQVDVFGGAPVGGTQPVEFSVVRTKDERASRQAGQPVFVDKEFIKIYSVGLPLEWQTKELNDDLKARFARQYQAWLSNKAQPMPGYPIEQWAQVVGDEVVELKSKGFHTLESLAQCDPDKVGKLLGRWGKDLQALAIAHFKSQEDTQYTSKITTQLSAISEENEYLKTEIDELKKAIADLQQAQGAKKRGG